LLSGVRSIRISKASIDQVDAAAHNRQDDQNGSRLYEANEVLVVAFAYASSEPWAMMVKSFDTAIANAAVDGSWRPVYITS
jgi:hypothetical protein